MQVESNWKAAANLQLLCGDTHPPVRIEHDPIPPARRPGEKVISRTAEEPAVVVVDARNTNNFRTTSYCSPQDPSTPQVRQRLIAYYREMLNRVPLWRCETGLAAGHTTVNIKAETAPSSAATAVKPEPQDEDNFGVAAPAAATDNTAVKREGSDGPAPQHHARSFRALGILTQVHDPIGEQAVVPWEFYIIPNVNEDAAFDGPMEALVRDIPQNRFPLLFAGAAGALTNGKGNGADKTAAAASHSNNSNDENLSLANQAGDSTNQGVFGQEGQRLSLYPKMLGPFTGLYPGMAIGIVGEPFQRSATGLLTGVLLRDLVLPHRPVFPWRVDRPLSVKNAAASSSNGPRPTRVHFCSGPFPRRDISALLRTVARQALHRGADLLIIGGPFIKPFEDLEKAILPVLGRTFAELHEGFVELLEETLEEYYAMRPHVPHMKVVLVSHPDDVTQVPVLPTTMYGVADSTDVCCRSNPCRISVNGVHFSVCNEDVVGHMREVMVERWPTAEGSLRRVVEALVQSRSYTPVTELPMTKVELKHLSKLRMDYLPSEEDQQVAETKENEVEVRPPGAMWDLVLTLDGENKKISPNSETELESKRVKREAHDFDGEFGVATAADEGGEGKPLPHSATAKAQVCAQVEYMPHVMFLPSTRPQFAHVTHRGVPHAEPPRASNDVDDESPLDATSRATGVLVVNQEVWSRRASPRFELRVAEVTISDSDLAARRGASPAHGVACGVLHVFNADRN